MDGGYYAKARLPSVYGETRGSLTLAQQSVSLKAQAMPQQRNSQDEFPEKIGDQIAISKEIGI